jgi:hypothetical protein
MYRAFFVLAFLAAPAGAGTVVIDDYLKPSLITELGEIVTQDVGDLGASRRLTAFRLADDDPIMRMEIANGRYVVDVDYAGFIFYAYSYYDFATQDFSQFDSVILDIREWSAPPGMISLMVVAEVEDGNPLFRSIIFAEPRQVEPGRLVLPFERFTDRGGGTIDPFVWSSIKQLWIQVGFSNEPWTVSFDRFAIGNAVPEPPSLACLATCVGLILYLRRGKHDVIKNGCDSPHGAGDVAGNRCPQR